MVRKVAAIFCGMGFYLIQKLEFFKDGSVFGKQAEQQAHQIHFKVMFDVTHGFQRVVQPAHALCGLDVVRVLRIDELRLETCHAAERFNVLVQIPERKSSDVTRSQIMQAKILKVANQHVARNITLLDAGEIIHGLGRRHGQDPCRTISFPPA